MANYNILVTGSKGQLGQCLRDELEARLPGRTTYLDADGCDITDLTALKGLMVNNRFTHVVNCAAYTAVDKAETEKSDCHRINVEGVKNLGLAAVETGAKVIHISTDYVFDGRQTMPYTETDMPSPLSQYGATKRKGEMALLALCDDAIIIRTGWLYSPYGHNFVKTMFGLAQKGINPGIVCDQTGTPTCGIDLAQAIVSVITAKAWTPGIYNFANEGIATWYDFACDIFRLGHEIKGLPMPEVSPIRSEEYPQAATRPHYSVLDKSKIKIAYGLKIRHWHDALRDCIERMPEGKQD